MGDNKTNAAPSYLDHRLDLSTKFYAELHSTIFKSIISNDSPGSCLYAVSELHILRMSQCGFYSCSTENITLLPTRPFPVSGGIVVFIGSSASLQNCCIEKCHSAGSAHTIYTSTATGKGTEFLGCVFFQNGIESSKGHSLFISDHGAGEFVEINATHNHIPMGYTAGHGGMHSESFHMHHGSLIKNKGRTIIGAWTKGTGKCTIEWTSFVDNQEVKTGHFVRAPEKGFLYNVVILNGDGPLFYGSAPLVLTRFFTDQPKSEYTDVDDGDCGFKWDLGLTYVLHWETLCKWVPS